MSEPVPVIAALEYASSRGTRRGRDVVVFVPSRRSVVLMLLAAGVAFWVGRRHVAWREVAGGGAFDPLATSISFTPEGRLLVCGVGAAGRGGGIANVYDAESGRLLHTLGRAKAAGGFVFALKGGREVAQIDAGVIHVYDADSGALVKTVSIPPDRDDIDQNGHMFITASPTERRFVTHAVGREGNFTVWDLDRAQEGGLPIALAGGLPDAHLVEFTLDGRFIVSYPHLQVYDARTLAGVMTASGAGADDFYGFAGGSQFFTMHFGRGAGTEIFLYAPPRPSPIYAGPNLAGATEGLAVSPDGRRLVVLKALPLARKPTVHLFELPGGREIARQDWRVERRFGYFKFFPDGRRLLVSAGMGGEVAILDTPSLGILAKLEKPGPFYQCAIAGSGRNFATVDMFMKVRLYRQVGGECRESTLGALGMPHVWLLLVLIAVGAQSLRADAARRAAEPPGRGLWLIALVLLLAALPRAGQFILTLCVEGRALWSATPLVLICAIGLAGGSRTWRMITMIVLVVCVAVNVFCLVQLRRAGLRESLVLGVADRSYTIANLALFVVLCGLTVGMMGVVVWLARLRLTSSV